MTENNNKIWNRRFKAWRVYFIMLIAVFFTVLFLDKPIEFFAEWGKWTTIAIVALIGGLSLTDAVFGGK